MQINRENVQQDNRNITQHNNRKLSQLHQAKCFTNLLKAGNDLRVVQIFAGHKHPSITEKYKQSKADAMQSAVNLYHPIK